MKVRVALQIILEATVDGSLDFVSQLLRKLEIVLYAWNSKFYKCILVLRDDQAEEDTQC